MLSSVHTVVEFHGKAGEIDYETFFLLFHAGVD